MKTKLAPTIGMLALLLASCTSVPSVDRKPIYGKAHNVFSIDEEVLALRCSYRQAFSSGKIVLVRYRGEILLTNDPELFSDVIKRNQPVPEFAGMTVNQAITSGHLGLMIMDKGESTCHTVAVYIHHKKWLGFL